jgi:hypothetical protein
MACKSDYLEPSGQEVESKKLCKFIVFVASSFKDKYKAPDWAVVGARNCYGDTEKLDDATRLLCKWCKELPEEFIYNGRVEGCRQLATWWDNHKEFDRKREEEEKAAKKKKQLRKQALSKLTKEERDALR